MTVRDDPGWKRRTEWPPDTPDYLFLRRAILLLGAAKFKGEWTGYEPVAAGNLIQRRAADTAAAGRFFDVAEEIRERLTDGRLKSALLHDGLGPQPLDKNQWLVEPRRLRKRCLESRMPTPSFNPTAGGEVRWIYIGKTSLEKALAELGGDSVDHRMLQEKLPRKKAKPRGTKYPWPEFNRKALSLFEYHGPFDLEDDPTWNQAKMIGLMKAWCWDKWEARPSPSTIQRHVKTVESMFMEHETEKRRRS